MIFSREGGTDIKKLTTEVHVESRFNLAEEITKLDPHFNVSKQKVYLHDLSGFQYVDAALLARHLGLPVLEMTPEAKKRLQQALIELVDDWRPEEFDEGALLRLNNVLLFDRRLLSVSESDGIGAEAASRLQDKFSRLRMHTNDVEELLCAALSLPRSRIRSNSAVIMEFADKKIADLGDFRDFYGLIEAQAILRITNCVPIPKLTPADIEAAKKHLHEFATSSDKRLRALFYLKILLADDVRYDVNGLHITDPAPLKQTPPPDSPVPIQKRI